ncbi:MAG: phospholipase D-like domain-containing protein [Thermoanaerobaculia bacterium]
MSLELKAYANCDDVHLVWRCPRVDGCRGFALRRRRGGGEPVLLDNRVGFAADNPQEGDHRPSTQWPFQRYNWTDHGASSGDRLEYQVQVISRQGDALVEGEASDWTPVVEVGPEAGDGLSAYFNRGFVISQFVSRILAREHLSLEAFKTRVGQFEDEIRTFLTGELGKRLFALLDEVQSDPGLELAAALYELADTELIDKLKALGSRAHVVLANGSVKPDDPDGDENQGARQALKTAGVEVHDRMVSPSALGHNKFLVVGRPSGADFNPLKAWTGSTNWTKTGLCTQVNNGILAESPEVAAVYYRQWGLLRDAGSGFPTWLRKANSTPTLDLPVGASKLDIWFTRTSAKKDLDHLKELVAGARQGILFTLFKSGEEPLASILARRDELYVRGVVNTFPRGVNESVQLIKQGDPQHFFLKAIEPEGVATPFGSWAAEVTHRQFEANIGFAITHSKVMVIDPFGANPVVVTGSHNFSSSASDQNDDNLFIVKGNRRLAEAYAVACISTYNHYRFRAYLQECKAKGMPPFEKLADDDRWQRRAETPDGARELEFWVG